MRRGASINELRSAFIDFFADRGHRVVPSSPIVPEGDPTLLFTTAGMVQFKPYYSATDAPPFTRAASCQKCLRGSDLENVGFTDRHHTFFEMLGNFSFGDYFKREAIAWAWEFVTEVLRIPPGKLLASVYIDDAEAYDIWNSEVGLGPERVARLGKEDNFWGPAGRTGACGPCSEIYIDVGEEFGCGKPDCMPGCDCDRYVEFWNLVFPQYDMDESGELKPLAHPGVDTGMGLERLGRIMQGVDTNFETDVFDPILRFLTELTGYEHKSLASAEESVRVGHYVIADHARALCFALADGVVPSSEGRGYLLRRILRRASRRGHELGLEEPFLYRVADVVVDTMGEVYPEVVADRERKAAIIKSEEERFQISLAQGIRAFAEVVESLKGRGETVVPGSKAFRLYDTFGFPIDMTAEMAREEGLEVDEEEFECALERQRERARGSSKLVVSVTSGEEGTESACISGSFVGYDQIANVETRLTSLAEAGEPRTVGRAGDALEVELERTPFYPESGGQVGDTGEIRGQTGRALVRGTVKAGADRVVHLANVVEGELGVDEIVTASVDQKRRDEIRRNHTATHLLQAALRETLGTHVRQSGSLVAPDRLRFDFSHFAALEPREIEEVEDYVNHLILKNLPVECRVTSYDDAMSRGAIALFGEKYGTEVRSVAVTNTSVELCGGTHVTATGEIGSFRILSESSVSAGARRIEAVTGTAAYRLARREGQILRELAARVRGTPEDVIERVERIQAERRELERKLERFQQTSGRDQVDQLLAGARRLDGVAVVAGSFEGLAMPALRSLGDCLRERESAVVGVLASVEGERVSLVAVVGDSAIKEHGLHAGRIVGQVASLLEGRGGGKSHLGQGGGGHPDRLPEVLRKVEGIVGDHLAKASGEES